MNKNDLNILVKFLAELDKKMIEDDEKYNLSLEQKEVLKKFVNDCYEKFKKENNIE